MNVQHESQNHVIERVTDFDSRPFAHSLSLLEQSMSAEARLPHARMMKLLSGNDYRLYILRLRDQVVGVALLYFSTALPFVLLDYFAIHAERRSRGLGSTFFQGLVELIRRQKPGADWLILEVDDDRKGPDQERAAGRRRIEFYRRLGAHLLVNVPYRFPSHHGRPVPMRLMAYRLRAEAILSPADLGADIKDSFAHVHGRAGDDELLRWFNAHKPASLDLE